MIVLAMIVGLVLEIALGIAVGKWLAARSNGP